MVVVKGLLKTMVGKLNPFTHFLRGKWKREERVQQQRTDKVTKHI